MKSNKEKSIHKLVDSIGWFDGKFDEDSKILTMKYNKEFFWIRHLIYALPAVIIFLTIMEYRGNSILLNISLPVSIILPPVLIYLYFKKEEVFTITPTSFYYQSTLKKIVLKKRTLPLDESTRIAIYSNTFGENNVVFDIFIEHGFDSLPLFKSEQFEDDRDLQIISELIFRVAKLSGVTIKLFIDFDTEILDVTTLEQELIKLRKHLYKTMF